MTAGRRGAAPDTALVDAIRAALVDAADPAAAEPMRRYMKSALPYHGVRVPQVRRLTRAIAREHPMADPRVWEATVRALYDEATHREERYAALGLVGHPMYRAFATPAALPLHEHLVRVGAWWDLVDEVAHRVGDVLASHPAEVAPVLLTWSRADSLWLRRCAIISQLGHGASTDLELLEAVIAPNLADREFFLRKAIGWALRDAARANPQWVRAYVDAHPGLSPLSRREALKHLGG